MSKPDRPQDERRKRSIDAVAVFTTLMHAYERGEIAKATDAQTELRRLGVTVRIETPLIRSSEDHEND